MSNGVLSIPGAQPSKLWINDELIWTAGGGAGQVTNNIVPNTCTSVSVQNGNGTSNGSWTTGINVHWHSGNGKSGATHSNSFPYLGPGSHPGGCYVADIHHHSSGCEGIPDSPWNNCGNATNVGGSWQDGNAQYECNCCGSSFSGSNAWHHCTGDAHKQILCGHSDGELLGYKLGCGYSQGQAYGYNNANYVAGQCYYKAGYIPTASLTRTGDGLFSIKLVEQETVYYKDVVASNPYYTNGRIDLAILDNTVCYYKRR